MCDYSLEFYKSIDMEQGQEYTLRRFPSGTKGFVGGVSSEGECDTVACMKEGSKFQLNGFDRQRQEDLHIGESEIVEFIELGDIGHRDGVRFSNGQELLLQLLNVGVTARLYVDYIDLSKKLGLDQIRADIPLDHTADA